MLWFVEIGVEIAEHGARVAFKIGVLQVHAQLVIRHFAQDGDGIMIKILPAARREFLKQILRLLVPAPPQVAGQFVEIGDQFVQFRDRQRLPCHTS